MKAGTKEYYANYYQKNKEKHNERMVKYQEGNEQQKIYQQRYHQNKNKKAKEDGTYESLKEIWRVRKIKLNQQRRDLVNNIKKEGCCQKCEEDRFYVLDFHHINPEEKLFDIGESTKYSEEKILNEINKCVLLCRNCHSEFHYLEKEQNITIHDYID